MKPTGLLLGLLIALLLAGCALLSSTQATRFYVLTPLTDREQTPPADLPPDQPPLAVGLAPVELPRYLDRPQIVTRISANELVLAEFDQWAEPLADSVTHTLAENMRRLLSSHAIDVLPLQRSNRSAYEVAVTLIRFESDVDNACVLKARWMLVDGREKSVRVQNTFDVRIPLAGAGYDAIAGTMSRALAALSRDIALHVRAVATQAAVR